MSAENMAINPIEKQGASQVWRKPRYDVHAVDESYEIRVLMPGVAKEGVKVSIDGDKLQIEGSRQHPPGENWRPLLNELSWHDYRLNLDLNVRVDEDAVSAQVENGVLLLTLPKAEEAKPKRIEVK